MNGYSRIAALPTASTGNDLVSLEATRPERTHLPRFYSRILTAAEQEDYNRLASSGLPFDHYVWLCWSVKEAVYKYKKRRSPGLVFAPLRIAVREMVQPLNPEAFYRCSAGGAGEIIYSRSVIRDGVIVTTVSEDAAFTGTYWGFSSIDSSAYANQSAAVRGLVLGKLRDVLSCDALRLQKDSAGCPLVLAGEKVLPIPVSLSHHARYIAYSFYLNKVV
jgi:4'-phosphopantetheinyl transferase superfamily